MANKHKKQNSPDTLTEIQEQTSQLSARGADILQQLQERCEQLRQWHNQAGAQLEQHNSDLEAKNAALDKDRDAIGQQQQQQQQEQSDLQNQRQSFDQQKQQLAASQSHIESQQKDLARSNRDLKDQIKDLKRMREELDGEWANLTRLRRAQETVAAALDADRERINSAGHLRLTPSNSNDDQVADVADQQDAAQAA
jgi:DNA repair exonuclease SbcCD ATPase subunit